MGRDSDAKLPRDAIKAKYTNILADRQTDKAGYISVSMWLRRTQGSGIKCITIHPKP